MFWACYWANVYTLRLKSNGTLKTILMIFHVFLRMELKCCPLWEGGGCSVLILQGGLGINF